MKSLKEARHTQEEAKLLADRSAPDSEKKKQYLLDFMFWTGYIAAMIDHDVEEVQIVEKRTVHVPVEEIEKLEPFKGKINLLPKKKMPPCECEDCSGRRGILAATV